jgi:hypothetical protein
MKVFWISLLLFCLLLGLTALNSHYIKSSVKELTFLLEKMTDMGERGEVLSSFEQVWKTRKEIIGLSAGTRVLEKIDDLLIRLRSANDFGNEEDVKSCRRLLIAALWELAERETVSLHGIF